MVLCGWHTLRHVEQRREDETIDIGLLGGIDNCLSLLGLEVGVHLLPDWAVSKVWLIRIDPQLVTPNTIDDPLIAALTEASSLRSA
jgi:hypothetical protein